MTALSTREEKFEEIAEKFEACLRKFEAIDPFNDDRDRGFDAQPQSWVNHQRTLLLREQLQTGAAAVRDPSFVSSLRSTLRSWSIWGQGAKEHRQVPFEDALKHLEDGELEELSIDQLSHEEARKVGERLWVIIDRGELTWSRRYDRPCMGQVVPYTKALHHVYPGLVPPMDTANTSRVITGITNPPNQLFVDAFCLFRDLAMTVRPRRYVTKDWREPGYRPDKWHTTPAKVLDNALIGYQRMREAGETRT